MEGNHVYLFIIKNICVCNAQLMQKAQQRRAINQLQLSEQKSFQSPRKQLNERVGSLRAGGREFQTPGPATAKARGPNVTVRVLGTSSSNLPADRRCCRPRVADSIMQSSARYDVQSVLLKEVATEPNVKLECVP